MRQILFGWLAILLIFPALVAAATGPPLQEVTALSQAFRGGLRGITGADHLCNIQVISCGQTRSGSIVTHDCATETNDTYFDIWSFQGTFGQTVTINLSSNDFDAFLLLLDPDLELATFDDDGGPGLNARIVHTLDETGTWFLTASGLVGFAQTGNYSLSLGCSGGPPPPSGPCVAGLNTLCLNNGRFRVEVDWRTAQGGTGRGNAVPLTNDTGYFWFFDAANVEMVLKVLTGCPINNHFWVFAGGLTNVEVDVTVTDTRSGVLRTYRNPLGTPFRPIQDTSAFATCP